MFQEKIPNYDFLLAKLKHIDWRIKFFAFLDEKNVLEEKEITSPHCCELGSWLDKEGLIKYKNCEEIKILEQLHNTLHRVSTKIIYKKNINNNIEQEYETLKEVSAQILQILENFENKMKFL